jgi:iron complex outermembrane receptor protein
MFISLVLNAQTDSTNLLTEVNISSTRAKPNSPISQTLIDMKLFKSVYQGQDLPVIMNFSSPVVTFYSDGGNYSGYMYYRIRGGDQTKINVTLNGAPLNEPSDQGAYFSNYQDFFSNISSIQIQKGVGTTSPNGSAQFLGSMNLQSPSLLDSGYTQLNFSGGSFRTNRYSVAVNTGLKNGWGTYVRYSNISSNSYRHNSQTLGNTIFLSTGWSDNKHIFKYTTFYGTSANNMAWLPSNIDSIKKDRQHNPLNSNEKDFFTQNMNILSYSYFFNKNLSSNTTFFYNYLKGNYDWNYNDTNYIPSGIYNYKLLSHYYGVSTNFNYFKNKYDNSFGISLSSYNREHSMGQSPYDDILIHDNIEYKNQYSIFYKLTYNISQKISIYTDIQYRYVDFKYVTKAPDSISTNTLIWNNFINPKIGVNYKLNLNSRVFGYFGISNREPTRVDMFNSYIGIDPDNLPSNRINNKINNGVNPERVYNFEIVYDYKNIHNNISTNLFFMKFKDGLLPIGMLNPLGLPINTNVVSSYRAGLEVDYTYSTKHFKFYIGTTIMTSKILDDISITYIDSTVDTTIYSRSYSTKNKQMLLTPNFVVNSNIQYMVGRYTISLFNKYVSDSYLTNYNSNGILPSYIVTNLCVNYHVKKLNVGFSINNLFNRDYYNAGQYANSSYGANPNAMMTQQFFVAAPRNYFVNLSYIF